MTSHENPDRSDITTQITTQDPFSAGDPDPCSVVAPEDPCTIIIMGATGDLTTRKLMPSLFNLYISENLPRPFSIVGCGRTTLDHQSFRNQIHDALKEHPIYTAARWEKFAANLYYHLIDYNTPSSFVTLAKFLEELDRKTDTRGNRIFYFALPPSLYQPVSQAIGQAGLGEENNGNNGWSRLVVEKPFGRDLPSAIQLDRGLQEFFDEHQIFRIDHYLAKETVQNVLMFRFSNTIFEPLWNRRYIDYVNITATETLGVEHRAGYYEQSGILRDMFQNHMMMLLALIAMEPPSRFNADQVRDERVKVFRALRPLDLADLRENLMLGQYGAGVIDGRQVPGYRDEPGVAPDSLTPTYAKMRVFLDNWRWQGVPFYLTSGKRLAQKATQIAIQFKEVPHSMFRRVLGETISANRLIIGIYPDEKITLTFQTKRPGAAVCLQKVTMDFLYHQDDAGPVVDAYEKVLVDAMLGDQMLFWHQHGVERTWEFLTPVLASCEHCNDRQAALHTYPAGSWGPDGVENIGPRAMPDMMRSGSANDAQH
jgi:glucose-6-phosphate 1-dehydrogenase